MGKRWASCLRRRARLHVEALEARTAPVVVTALTGPYVFTDGNGDQVTLTMTGKGQVDIYDAGGNNPGSGAGSDIANMFFSGTNATSAITIAITAAGGSNDVTAGDSLFLDSTKTQLGTMTINAPGGTVTGTTFQDINLLNLAVHATTVTGCTFAFGIKTVNSILLDAATANLTTVSADRSVKVLYIGGNFTSSTINIGQDVQTRLEILGAVTTMSHITVTRNATLINLQNGVDNSSVYVGGVAKRISIIGGLNPAMANGATLGVGRDAKEIDIGGNIDGSALNLNGKVGTLDVMGDVLNNSEFNINCSAKEIAIHWTLTDSAIYVNSVTTLGISDDVIGSAVEIYGNAKTVWIGGDLGADAVGDNSSLWIAGNATLIDIDGSVLGDSTTPAISSVEVEGTLGTLTIGGSVEDSTLWCGANAKSVIIGDGAPGGDDVVNSALNFREKVTSFRVDGNITDSSQIYMNALQTGVIQGNVTQSYIYVYDDAKSLNVTGALTDGVLSISGSATTVSVGALAGTESLRVLGDLKTLNVAGDIGTAVGAQPRISAGSMGTATVGGLVYGSIDVFGALGSILTGGTNATPTAPTTVPFIASGGAMAFQSGLGAPTGGVVQYMTLKGIVS